MGGPSRNLSCLVTDSKARRNGYLIHLLLNSLHTQPGGYSIVICLMLLPPVFPWGCIAPFRVSLLPSFIPRRANEITQYTGKTNASTTVTPINRTHPIYTSSELSCPGILVLPSSICRSSSPLSNLPTGVISVTQEFTWEMPGDSHNVLIGFTTGSRNKVSISLSFTCPPLPCHLP